MKFDFTQRIQATPEEVEQALFHPDYPAHLLKEGVLLEAQQLELKDEGERIRRRMRYRPKPVIKSVGPKDIPPEWFAFVEESTWDKKRRELTFRNVPTSNAISNMLVNTGVLRIRDAGGGQSERTMAGEINIKVPFLMKPLGLIAEKIIQHEGVKLLESEIPALHRFVTQVIRK